MYPYSVSPIAYFLCNCPIIAEPGNWHCCNVHIVLCHLITSVDSVTTTSIKIRNCSIITKISVVLPLYTYTHSSTHHSRLQQLLICTTFLWFLSVWGCHGNEIIPYITLGLGLSYPSRCLWDPSPLLLGLFLFIAESCSLLWMAHCLFNIHLWWDILVASSF